MSATTKKSGNSVTKPSPSSTARRFRALLDGYAARRGEAAPAPEALFRDLLDGFRGKFQAWRKSEENSASDFNLLDTLQIFGEEVRHSMMLAWLLDRRIERAGTHAQGNKGFLLFLKELGLDERYAESEYLVRREVRGDESIVDIEIAARGRFVIHIENKIYSEEGEDQTEREWRDLQERARDLGVKLSRAHGFFITLSGDPPTSKHFEELGWNRIASILDAFAEQAKAPEVSMFASHYARALRRMTIEQPETYEDEDETETDS